MARKGGLGKGLDALIPGEFSSPLGESGIIMVSPEKIIPNPRQPRSDIPNTELEDLAASIREHGILQPLIVTHEPDQDKYILIAGERRLRAASLAGLQSVPVLVRKATEQERLELALIENIQRTDLAPLETAKAYRQLIDEFNLTHDDIALQIGKSRVTVTNTLRLLNLPQAVQTALSEGKISEGHARALLGLNSPQAQIAALHAILTQDLNVRQAEGLVRKLSGGKPERIPHPALPPEIIQIEERLRSHFGTRVTVNHGKHGGSLVIHYYSDEDLNTLLDRLLKD